jgi:hypothetical protein
MSYFVEGEPLDVDKLNSLKDELTNLNAKFSAISTSIDENGRTVSQIPVIHSGSEDIRAVKGTDLKTISMPNSPFRDGEAIDVVACPKGKIEGQITVSVYDVSAKAFKIAITATVAQSVKISYIAISKRYA